jgi:hypothetical protein
MSQNPNAILREWISQHIVALGSQGVDPGDRELIAKRRSQELLEFAAGIDRAKRAKRARVAVAGCVVLASDCMELAGRGVRRRPS